MFAIHNRASRKVVQLFCGEGSVDAYASPLRLISLRPCLLAIHNAQNTGCGLSIKCHPSLLQDVRFNLFKVRPQGVHTARPVRLSTKARFSVSTVSSSLVNTEVIASHSNVGCQPQKVLNSGSVNGKGKTGLVGVDVG